MHILKFIFVLVILAAVHSVYAQEVSSLAGARMLERKIFDSSLSDLAKRVLLLQVPISANDEDVTFEAIVQLPETSLGAFPQRKEIGKYLESHNLRMGMTAKEVRFFKEFGRVPKTDLNSQVDSLDVSARIRRRLIADKVFTYGDIIEATAEGLVGNGRQITRRDVDKIRAALQEEGHWLPANRKELADPERAANDRASSLANFLSTRTANAFAYVNIRTLPELRANADRFYLEKEIPGLGAKGIDEVEQLFKERGWGFHDDYLAQQLALGESIDPAITVDNGVRASRGLHKSFRLLNVEEFKTLLDPVEVAGIMPALSATQAYELRGILKRVQQVESRYAQIACSKIIERSARVAP